MDAETRHQLKSNELAEALEKLSSLNDPRVKWGIAAVVVVAAAFLGYRVWSWSRAATLSDSWRQLSEVNTLDPTGDAAARLRALLAAAPDPSVAAAVRLRLGEALVQRAVRQPGPAAEELLREAVAALTAVADANVPLGYVAPATFLLGGAYESLRDLDRAADAYRRLQEPRFHGFPYQALAAERLASLDELRTAVRFVDGAPPAAPAPESPAAQQTPPAPASDSNPTAPDGDAAPVSALPPPDADPADAPAPVAPSPSP